MVMCVPSNCSGVWSQGRRFGSVQSLNKKILPCSSPGGHVRSSKLLGCVVTMQEVLNRAKFEFGFFGAPSAWLSCTSSKLLGCVVTLQEVRKRAKFELGFSGAHPAWLLCASSKLLGCAVTMQEVRNRAKFVLVFRSVLIQLGCHVRPANCLCLWSQCRRFGIVQSLN